MLSIVIPTKNEPGVKYVIEEIRDALKGYNYEIIIIDKSDDNTYELVKSMGITPYRQKSRGYGNAYMEGIEKMKGDILVMIDGDHSYSAYDLPAMIDLVADGEYDFVIGNRWPKIHKGAMPFINKIGNKIITGLINFLFKMNIADSQCGIRVISRKALEKCTFKVPGMGFASEMLIQAKIHSLKIKDFPVSYESRIGHSKLSPIRDGIKIVSSIIKQWFGLKFNKTL